jgi:hypothetical protein
MPLTTALTNAFRRFGRALGRGILRIAPRHGFLDTIFHSYDDWREFQEQGSAPLKNDKVS